MKNAQTIQTADQKIEVPSQKLSYTSPVFQSYGAVSTLTQGASGTKSDGTFLKKP